MLISKKRGAEDLRDFRLISFVGGLYKWMAKVLTNRLKLVIAKVISKANMRLWGIDKYWMQFWLPMKPLIRWGGGSMQI